MLLPGGMPVVHSDDVATAHVRAVDGHPPGAASSSPTTT